MTRARLFTKIVMPTIVASIFFFFSFFFLFLLQKVNCNASAEPGTFKYTMDAGGTGIYNGHEGDTGVKTRFGALGSIIRDD